MIIASKRFGQHFYRIKWLFMILLSSHLNREDHLVEKGPGLCDTTLLAAVSAT